MTTDAHKDAARKFSEVIQHLDVEHLDELTQLFAPSARFQDPFNNVVGREAIKQVFAHGFSRCPNLCFMVEEIAYVTDSPVVFFYWRFFCGTAEQLTITGVSRVVFDEQGFVTEHVDYWDPAAQLYEKIPMIGGLMRWIRRYLSA